MLGARRLGSCVARGPVRQLSVGTSVRAVSAEVAKVAVAAPPLTAAPAAAATGDGKDPLFASEGLRRILKLPAGTLDVTRPASKRGSAPVRIEGYSIQPQRGALWGLTAIFGVGKYQASRLCAKAFLNETLQVAQLTTADIERLSLALKEMSSPEANADAPQRLRFDHGERLQRQVGNNIQQLKAAGTYRGLRHTRGLPMRGQRTKSNAKTSRRRPKYGFDATT